MFIYVVYIYRAASFKISFIIIIIIIIIIIVIYYIILFFFIKSKCLIYVK